jgi:6-phosphogluconate dehydrogenase (decarboxylating)
VRESDEDKYFKDRATTTEMNNEVQAPMNRDVQAPILRRSTRNRFKENNTETYSNKSGLDYSLNYGTNI